MRQLSRRVAALEKKTAPTEHRTFFQLLDDQRLYVEAPKRVDYRAGLMAAADGPTLTRPQVERIRRGGAAVIVVNYVDWRDYEITTES